MHESAFIYRWIWITWLWAGPMLLQAKGQPTPFADKIADFDERTFINPAAVVREGTALWKAQGASMVPEDIVGLSVVIAESAGLYGKSETVWEWVQRGQAVIDRVDRPVERIRLYSLAGVAMEFQGKSQDARASHMKAIATAVAHKNLAMEAYALELFTYFANREADYRAVVENVKRLQEIYQQLPRGLAYYNTRAAVGSFFASDFYKRHDEGIALIKEAIAYFETHDKTFLAFNYNNSLTGLYALIKPEEAIRLGLQLIEKFPDTPDMPYSKYVSDSLGGAYFKLQNYREALHYFRRSAEFWQGNGDNKLYYSELMFNVCQTYIKLKDYDKAWETCEKIRDFPGQASLSNKRTWYELQADLARHRAQPSEELRALRKLVELTNQYHEEQNADISQKMAAQFDLKRIEEQKNQLELINQAKTLELERVERIQRLLILLSILILGLLVLALLYIRKRHEALEKQKVLQEILDTINEGIVRIGKGRKILPYYSRATSTFLGRDDSLVGQEILPILLGHAQLPTDQIRVIEECLNTILGEHADNWEFNGVHLPQQIKVGTKVLSLAWQPTIRHQKVEDLILTIVDISRHLELEEEVRVERKKNSAFHELIGELRRVSMQRALNLLKDIQARLQNRDILKDKVWLHTQKGIARTLGLQKLSDAIHQLETSVIESEAPLIRDALNPLEETLQNYFAVAQEIGPQIQPEAGQDLLALSSEILGGLRPTLAQHGITLKEIQVVDRYQAWTEKRLKMLREILVHAITNSFDHGFIRSQKHEARLQIEAYENAGAFHLSLRDNGSGLNWDHIKKMARERGLSTDDPERLAALLFEDGISTTQMVSTLSGRGLGLSAIRQNCQKLDGHCSLADNPDGPGTEMRLSWPESSWDERLPKVS
ncbi:MAG TPA: ATP-binding protein [Oligoflexus sp.]|uniref:ATP-binding protein n=1 Tax=Oligoflexus sp. TaxID=1971216 RepID=UPI002D7E384E|nr:ATP-binding protein [Oligoflexus sp.]HET9240254.1 ATP-binding protein [Oligoflexus sp.]